MSNNLSEKFNQSFETLEGEHLKSLAEFTLHSLAKTTFGQNLIELASGGERIEDPRLNTEVADINFENPVMVGAGWDKKGRAVDGLYMLGFAGTEVGSVLVHPQAGNARPRLWTDKSHSVGLNRLGFNSSGEEVVADNLEEQQRLGVVGISLGKNKLTPDEQAPWAHAAVAERLHEYADYFVINVASPNTPGLRNLLNAKPLTEIIHAVQEVLIRKGPKPLFVKTTVDLAIEDLDSVLAVCVAEGVNGIIDTNTTVDPALKKTYGWEHEMGGLSGNDPRYRELANRRMRHITNATKGTGLQRIGVGAINDSESAMQRIIAGAQIVQIVTGIRQRRAKIAREINEGILERMVKDDTQHISDYVGIGTATFGG